MPLPVNVTLENCHFTADSAGLIPIDGAIQWQDAPTSVDFGITDGWTGEESLYDSNDECIFDFGAKGTFAGYLGSMASQTTRRVHCPGVPLDRGERITGTVKAGSIATTMFTNPGDGLAKLGGDLPELEVGSTVLTAARNLVRDFNPLRESREIDGRNSTYGMYFRWRLLIWPGSDRVSFMVEMPYTDERKVDRLIAWPRIRIRVPIAWGLHVEHSSRCPAGTAYTEGAYRYWDIVPAHSIFDAQNPRFRGSFFVGSEGTPDWSEWQAMPGNKFDVPRLLCDPEEFRGKLFFYDGLPAKPLSFDDSSCRSRYAGWSERMKSRDTRYGPNDYTRPVHLNELNNRANDGGSQPDFASGPFYESFVRSGGNPLRLPELDAAGDRHISRPITQRRRGLDEVDPNDARIVKWGDYTDTDFVLASDYIFLQLITANPDVRGKATDGENAKGKYYRGMVGVKRSHQSYLHAIESMFLTGCFDAEDIVRQRIELWLYTWIINTSYTHARVAEMRYARSLDMAAWMWFVTGDSRIVTHMNSMEGIKTWIWDQYYDHVNNNHVFRTWGGTNKVLNDRVDLGGGDVRWFRGRPNDPWQIALAIGYYRCYQLTGKAFFLTCVQDITRTWVFLFRFGRYRLKSRSGTYYFVGPRWHAHFQMMYPGFRNNPGTYGEFPPASWLTEAGEFIYWKANNTSTWYAAMLCLTIHVHANERATRDRALAVLAQELVPWYQAQNVSIMDDRGEWYGDDELVPGYRSTDHVIDAAPEDVYHRELGFSLDFSVIEATADLRYVSEPGATLELAGLDLDAVADLRETFEPPVTLEMGTLELIADSERVRTAEGESELDLVLNLDAVAEVQETTEPGTAFYMDFVASPEEIEHSEPDAVLDMRPVGATAPTMLIPVFSGPTPIDVFSGATVQESVGSGPTQIPWRPQR